MLSKRSINRHHSQYISSTNIISSHLCTLVGLLLLRLHDYRRTSLFPQHPHHLHHHPMRRIPVGVVHHQQHPHPRVMIDKNLKCRWGEPWIHCAMIIRISSIVKILVRLLSPYINILLLYSSVSILDSTICLVLSCLVLLLLLTKLSFALFHAHIHIYTTHIYTQINTTYRLFHL